MLSDHKITEIIRETLIQKLPDPPELFIPPEGTLTLSNSKTRKDFYVIRNPLIGLSGPQMEKIIKQDKEVREVFANILIPDVPNGCLLLENSKMVK